MLCAKGWYCEELHIITLWIVLWHCSHFISELIFKKVATEIEHILRLSKLKEYASH